jgi:hypothetical protein
MKMGCSTLTNEAACRLYNRPQMARKTHYGDIGSVAGLGAICALTHLPVR